MSRSMMLAVKTMNKRRRVVLIKFTQGEFGPTCEVTVEGGEGSSRVVMPPLHRLTDRETYAVIGQAIWQAGSELGGEPHEGR